MANDSYLYGWEHPDDIRDFRLKHKSILKHDKRTTLKEAVERGVKAGSYVAFGGMGSVRSAMATVHEIIRQEIGDLTVAAKGNQHDWQLLASAGYVTKAEVAYGFADEIRGLSRPLRKAVENGRIKVISETTNAAFQWRLTAAAKGLPFYPTRSALGTDTLKYSGSKTITDPFTGEHIELLPACYPDVAIIHVHRADQYGNCQIDGNIANDFELAHAAKFVLITAEEIVQADVIQTTPELTKIPYFVVDAVVEVPYGSHPNQLPRAYSFDEDHWKIWLDATLDDEAIERYLEAYIYGSEDHFDYLEKIGGIQVLNELEKIENKISPYPKVARRG